MPSRPCVTTAWGEHSRGDRAFSHFLRPLAHGGRDGEYSSARRANDAPIHLTGGLSHSRPRAATPTVWMGARLLVTSACGRSIASQQARQDSVRCENTRYGTAVVASTILYLICREREKKRSNERSARFLRTGKRPFHAVACRRPLPS